MRAILMLLSILFSSIPLCSDAQPGNAISEALEKDYKLIGAPMPHFELRSIDGKIYTEQDLAAFEHLVLILFNPTCDHCIDLGKEIATSTEQFEKTALVFIAANGMEDYLKYFLERTGSDKAMSDHILMGTDQTANAGLGNSLSVFLAQIFEFRLPQVNIYNKERNLIFKRAGAVKLAEILPSIKQ